MLSSLKTALTWGVCGVAGIIALLIVIIIAGAIYEGRSFIDEVKKSAKEVGGFIGILRVIFMGIIVIATIRFLWDVLGAYW